MDRSNDATATSRTIAKNRLFKLLKDLRENDNLYLEMFLESRYPQAFITLAKVIQIKPQAEGDEVLVRFADLSEQNQQWLDKYVFQLHRRQVALSRKTDRPLVFK